MRLAISGDTASVLCVSRAETHVAMQHLTRTIPMPPENRKGPTLDRNIPARVRTGLLTAIIPPCFHSRRFMTLGDLLLLFPGGRVFLQLRRRINNRKFPRIEWVCRSMQQLDSLLIPMTALGRTCYPVGPSCNRCRPLHRRNGSSSSWEFPAASPSPERAHQG